MLFRAYKKAAPNAMASPINYVEVVCASPDPSCSFLKMTSFVKLVINPAKHKPMAM